MHIYYFQKNADLLMKIGVFWWGRTDPLACGRATAVAGVHRTPVKSRLSYPPYASINYRAYPTDGFAFLRKSHGRVNSPPDCLLGPAFRIRPPEYHTKPTTPAVKAGVLVWWGRTDSNHRSDTQQIYSLSPLATRELPHIQLSTVCLEPVDGLEPPTC